MTFIKMQRSIVVPGITEDTISMTHQCQGPVSTSWCWQFSDIQDHSLLRIMKNDFKMLNRV